MEILRQNLHSEIEEANIPEKFTKENLEIWNRLRNGQSLHDAQWLECEPSRMSQLAEQHQMGLSTQLERIRKFPPKAPDLRQRTDDNLPPYLNAIHAFNPELMREVKTTIHCTLPSTQTIADEVNMFDIDKRKAWPKGVVLHKQASLVDHRWNKSIGDEIIRDRTQATLENSPSVMLGVLQHWQQSDRSPIRSPVRTSERQDTASSVASPRAATRELEAISEVGESRQHELEHNLRHSSR